MEYTVQKNATTTFMVEAESPQEAIAQVQKGGPEPITHNESFGASPRQGVQAIKTPALAASGKPSSAQ